MHILRGKLRSQCLVRQVRQAGLLGLIFLLTVVVTDRSAEAAIKNVLFIISDDLKASVLGCYGDKVCRTPNIDKLASQGLVFDRAYCQGTSCGPSRRSFMFSRYKGRGVVNLGEHFKENGWYSARVGKIYHMRVPGDIIAGTSGATALAFVMNNVKYASLGDRPGGSDGAAALTIPADFTGNTVVRDGVLQPYLLRVVRFVIP